MLKKSLVIVMLSWPFFHANPLHPMNLIYGNQNKAYKDNTQQYINHKMVCQKDRELCVRDKNNTISYCTEQYNVCINEKYRSR